VPIHAILAASLLAAAPSTAAPVPDASETAESAAAVESDVVARANRYLRGLESVEGRFVQINPDGSAHEGDIYLDRPGKARFEYDDYPLLIVSDGLTVAQRDTALETTDRASLKATPLFYLLKPDIDLAADAEVLAAGESDGLAFVTLADPDGEYEGALTLYFSGPSLELREWIAEDALGQETRFVLTGFSRADRLDPRLFTLDEDDARDRRGRR